MKLRILVVLLVLGVGAAVLSASGPIGVYAIVERVILEPNDAKPERIQIWGAFSIGSRNGGQYSAPRRGYLYYKLDTQSSHSRQASLAAWADLRQVAGSDEVVGFGGGFYGMDRDVNGTIRKVSDKPRSPDVFPVGNPVVPIGANRALLAAQLKYALKTQ
jgi:hypothetical protein